MTAGLLLLALFALTNYGAEVLAVFLNQSSRAWEYVLQGGEAAALWAVVAAGVQHIVARGACALGAWEAMQRPVCRLAFPMDRPPATDLNLCEAAIGLPVAWLNALAALFVAILAQEVQRAEATAH